jgi:hypothetical protein
MPAGEQTNVSRTICAFVIRELTTSEISPLHDISEVVSSLMTRAELVLETLLYSPLSILTRLLARERFKSLVAVKALNFTYFFYLSSWKNNIKVYLKRAWTGLRLSAHERFYSLRLSCCPNETYDCIRKHAHRRLFNRGDEKVAACSVSSATRLSLDDCFYR